MIKEILKRLPKNRVARQICRLNIIAGDSKTAFRFGPKVKKLELVLLSKNIYTKSAGLKKFWGMNLPTLKFHNDDVDFVVTRVRPKVKADYDKVPCAILVHSSSGEVTKVPCEFKSPNKILSELVRLTEAQRIPDHEIPRLQLPEES